MKRPKILPKYMTNSVMNQISYYLSFIKVGIFLHISHISKAKVNISVRITPTKMEINQLIISVITISAKFLTKILNSVSKLNMIIFPKINIFYCLQQKYKSKTNRSNVQNLICVVMMDRPQKRYVGRCVMETCMKTYYGPG